MLLRSSPPIFSSSVQLLSCVQLFATPWTVAYQASLSITNSQSLLKLLSIESVIPSNHLILCHHLLLLPSIFPSIRVFSNKSALHFMWAEVLELQHQYFQRTFRIDFLSVQFSSVAQLCLTLCHPMDCSIPGFPIHHQLLEFAQTHVHRVGTAIQPSHPLSSPSPPAFSLSQPQGLFQ